MIHVEIFYVTCKGDSFIDPKKVNAIKKKKKRKSLLDIKVLSL